LALWKLSGKVVKTTSRWNSRQSEIEDLCNKIASEVLAPQSDVLKQVTAFSIEKDLFALLNAPLQTKTASQTILDSIVHISNVFEVSLHFSAARIYEVYMPRFAIILVDSSEKKLVWCVGISHSNELLHAILSAFTSTDQRGSGSYSAASRQGERIRNFIWRRIKKHLVLAAVQK
jgi:hypothetical protein